MKLSGRLASCAAASRQQCVSDVAACASHEWAPSDVPNALWRRIVRHLEAHKIRHPLFGAKAKRLRGVDAH